MRPSFGSHRWSDAPDGEGGPDLRGRVALHQGTGPGLSPRRLGSKGGAEKETLTLNQLASHSHDWNASRTDATS